MSSNGLRVRAIQTEVFHPGDDLLAFLGGSFQREPLRDGMIVAVTSKIVSVAEARIVSKDTIDKKTLIQREADIYLGEIGYGCHLTVKHGLLIASAGIDESNSEQDGYILYPVDPFESARLIHQGLCQAFGLRRLGVILTDSHTKPLRRGVIGVALSYWGFLGTRSFVGEPDLFGRPLKMTEVNVVDALAATAVLAMGESNERRPLAVIEGADVEFTDQTSAGEMLVSIDEDLYGPLLKR
jgi:coenzyme F420-0:L-glutamate ligase